nr:transposase [Carnobacterium gallinarum]
MTIPETDLVRAVNGLVESIPEAVLYQVETKTGRPAYHPKLRVKVLLYAYTQNQFSGRKKEKLLDEKTTAIYKKRKVDVEPVFGFLKAHLGFTRFYVQGHEQVTNEIGLTLMAINLGKLTVRGREKSLKKETTWKHSVILNVPRCFFSVKDSFVSVSFLCSYFFFILNF